MTDVINTADFYKKIDRATQNAREDMSSSADAEAYSDASSRARAASFAAADMLLLNHKPLQKVLSEK